MGPSFVHLHVHTEFSLLESSCRIVPLLQQVQAEGMEAIAITDRMAMYGVIPFYREARRRGIQPIIGCEVQLLSHRRGERAGRPAVYALPLLAETLTGYRNLLQLVSHGHLHCKGQRAALDLGDLAAHAAGLIALTGGQEGELTARVMEGDLVGARRVLEDLLSLFGREHLFIELQDHGMLWQRQVNQHLLQLAQSVGVGVVATNEVRYVKREEAPVYDTLLAIGQGKTLRDPSRRRADTDMQYLASAEEMARRFAHVPEAIENSQKIAERCRFDLPLGESHLPAFDLPPGYDADAYLAQLCEQGIRQRYGRERSDVRERLNHELAVIRQLGFAGYFLVVWDFMKYAHQQGISTGPGRGSAAGSLVAYLLHITDVDPLRYGLLFERFLNPERVSWPDIDIDFADERRGEMIDYVTQKYGLDHVAQIITYGTMAARAAVRDVGRVMGMTPREVDALAKRIPHRPGMTLAEALSSDEDLRRLYETDDTVRQVIDKAQAIEGLPRHTSIHAAGVVISREPLTHYVPLQRGADGGAVTQYAMEDLEAVGLLKMDFLGLRTLTVIDQACAEIHRLYGKEIDFSRLPMDDKRTYELLTQGDTDGCFQLESAGVKAVLKELRPSQFEDIVAVISLYRPGPMEHIPTFIRAKHGEEPIHYPHPSLAPILRETYGVIVYQEQIMQIASVMAGFSLGQADLLRRAVGKKKRQILDEQRKIFVQGCLRNGHDENTAQKIYDLIVKFADYGFNKSHGVAYAVLAYRTAYLKANYRAAFMAALLTSWLSSPAKVAQYVEDCRRKGMAILPPDVNRSTAHFCVEDGNIRFSLAAVKNVGTTAIHSILAARKEGAFRDLLDFCRRVDLRVCNKRVIESLIRVGAFDWTGHTRRGLLLALDEAMERGARLRREGDDRQIHLFGGMEPGEEATALYVQPVGDFSEEERAQMEKELLGVYLTSHPLDKYRHLLTSFAIPLSSLSEFAEGQAVTVGGMVRQLRITQTKKGQTMAFFLLEDLSSSCEVVVFPSVYARAGALLQDEAVIGLQGRIRLQEDGVKLIADKIHPLAKWANGFNEDEKMIVLRITPQDEQGGRLLVLKQWLEKHPGTIPVALFYTRTRQARIIQGRVSPSAAFLAGVERILGKGSVVQKKREKKRNP